MEKCSPPLRIHPSALRKRTSLQLHSFPATSPYARPHKSPARETEHGHRTPRYVRHPVCARKPTFSSYFRSDVLILRYLTWTLSRLSIGLLILACVERVPPLATDSGPQIETNTTDLCPRSRTPNRAYGILSALEFHNSIRARQNYCE